MSDINTNNCYEENFPIFHPILRRSYKTFCLFCNKLYNSYSKYRKAICDTCFILFIENKQKILINGDENYEQLKC